MTKQKIRMARMEREVKLHINRSLFEQGYLSREMFQQAQEKILRTTYGG
ncbi:MAG: hypothetical protein HFE85_03485 [Clostridiales bacterium]|nr:hypothetical protein [Clostridiales bacterium]